MTIILTIDSVDSLPDGGPMEFRARNRGFEIGRQQHLDWTLPDPNRYISGVHCDIRFEKGGYWLYDVSRNGTFLNGATARVKSPYRLADGDRLTIGNYIVRVELPEAASVAVPEPGAAPAVREPLPDFSGNIWDTGTPVPPPIDRRELMPQKPGSRAPDFSSQFLEFPDMRPARPMPESPFADPRSEPAAPPELPAFRPAPLPFDAPRPPAGPPPPAGPAASRPRPFPVESESFSAAAPAAAVRPVAPAPQPLPLPRAAPPADQAGLSRFMEGLAAGAGVSPETFSGRDPAEIGHEVGTALKVAVEQLSQLLRARAAAKAMTKSSSRTMIGATDNNPLKFIPGTAEIIDVMFSRRRPGFLGARESLEAGFGDLKRHEIATYAAMQKALSRLLDDISPESISAKAGSSAFSSKKSRAWDLFEERWEQKTGPNENGMLDVFLGYFSEAYDEASKKS